MTKASRIHNERAIWDKLASRYDNNVMETFEEAYRLTNQAILEEVTSQSSILEIGCGTGIVSLGIAPQAGEVVGVDISPKMIALAEEKARKSNCENVTFQEADAYDLPFEDESFDIVLLTNLLHVVAEPTTVLKEAHRVLRTGGVLATVTDCMAEHVPFRVWLYLLGLRAMKLFGKVKYFHLYRRSDLKKLLENNGFAIQQEKDFHKAPVNFYLSGSKGE
ncbi:MAG: class I SAM-dependent methyltransferase [Brevefilum sp.]